MSRFTVIYSKGRAAISGSNVQFQTSSERSTVEVDAATRLEAFIKAREHLVRLGLPVFVSKPATGDSPLGFSEEEIAVLKEQGVPLQTDIENGARIEKIVPQP